MMAGWMRSLGVGKLLQYAVCMGRVLEMDSAFSRLMSNLDRGQRGFPTDIAHGYCFRWGDVTSDEARRMPDRTSCVGRDDFLTNFASIHSPPSNRVVIATRPVTYPPRVNANQFKRNHKRERRDDRGGTGTQIAAEVRACPACARR
jgi:hypothetical protein